MKAVAFALLLLLCVPARATEPSCAVPPCPSKRELKEATKSYKAGLKLAQQGHAEQAFRKFERAARLDGRNAEYVTAAELARQQLAADHIDRGNALLAQKLDAGAGAEFARALKLDPADPFAAQRLRDAVAAEKGPRLSPELQIVEDSQPVQVRAAAAVHDFDFRGDTRLLYQQIAQAYGVTAQFDDGLTARQVRMTVQGVDFPTAMSIAAKLTKTFWVPLTPTQFLVANDTAELRRQLEPVGLHTFYVKNAATPQELSEVLGLLRGIFDIRYASLSPSQDTITVRAPQATMVAVERFLRYLPGARPQVALDVKVYEVDGTVLRNLGVGLPLQYTLFNIPSEARNLLNTPGTQDLINQLISSGAINQGNVTGIEALIGQLLSGQQSIFNQPFATFGGGLTLSGLAVQPATVVASLNQTSFRSLTHMTLRSGDGQPATLRLGSRFPILNASFSPISNSAALSQVIGNLSFQAAFPSFTYEDIGLTFKTTPQIHGDSDVTLDTEMSVKQLTGQSFNGVPVLSNREYKGMIRIPDGTTAVVVGTISQSDQRSITGPPLLSLIPGLRSLVSTTNVNKTQDEILITITPHIVRGPDPRDPGEIVLPSSGQ